jgi:CAI-1 autoinducer synthase
MRLTLHAKLSAADIERLLGTLADIRDQVGLDDWPSTRRMRRAAAAVQLNACLANS